MSNEAASTARRIAKGDSGSLAIGFTASVGYGLLPAIVKRIRDISPDIRLTLKEMVSSAQLEALGARQIDLGILRPPVDHGELATLPCSMEALVLAIPERLKDDWPLKPTITDFDQKPLLMYSTYEAKYFHLLLSGLFEKSAVQPEIVEYVSQIHTMLALVRAGLGVAIIPQGAATLRFDGVIFRPIKTLPAKPAIQLYAFRKDNDNPILRLFKAKLGSDS